MSKQVIYGDVFLLESMSLVEGKDGNPTIIEGVFQRADTPNKNNRVYTQKLWDRLLSEASPVNESIKGRMMIGHMNHPKDGVTDLKEGAILVTKLWQEGKDIKGRAEILNFGPGTPGYMAEQYIRRGVKVGISSRGRGTLAADGGVNPDDFMLESFDLVYNPSTHGAYPTLVATESAKVVERSDQSPNIVPPSPVIGESKDAPKSILPTKEKRMSFEAARLKANRIIESEYAPVSLFEAQAIKQQIEEAMVEISETAEGANAILAKSIIDDLRNKRSVVTVVKKPVEEAKKVESSEDVVALKEEIEALRKVVGMAKDEIESLMAKNEETAEKLGAAEKIIEAYTEAKPAEVADVNEELAAKYQAALSLLSQNSEIRESELFEAALEECRDQMITNNPVLEDARGFLNECTSVEQIQEKAKELTALLGKRSSVTKPRSSTLPSTVTESADVEEQKNYKLSESASRSAQIAHRMLLNG